ncbi:mechanosensitive ion channel domain-containing protein [Nitrosophilus alvini]|uniref:mechanosensitive ion channel domain-containing protein n=1 Tax=Nitrosophilus alvini TaxID=2714855 RepID=UPI001F2CBC42|nr:mechanosensitive ion channel domain-containing protein [Nitrosophilus alvini]
MKLFLTIFLFFATLFAADINTTLLSETNATKIYESLMQNIEKSSSPEAKLQKTLVLKIKKIPYESLKIPDFSKLKIRNQNEFIENFYKLIEIRAKQKKLSNEIKNFKKEIENIKKEISSKDTNATDLLTLQLEYAYHYKKLQQIKKDIEYIDKNFYFWLEYILKKLENIKFDAKKAKSSISYYNKKISYIDKQLDKLEIEKQRWELLGNKTNLESTKKQIATYLKQKDIYLKRVIKKELILFFDALKKKDDPIFKYSADIELTAAKLSTLGKEMEEALAEGLNYAIKIYLGETQAYIHQTKELVKKFLQKNTLFDVPLYKFALALGTFLIFLVFRKIFTLVIIKSLKQIVAKTKTSIDDRMLAIVSEPLKFAFIIIGFYLAVKIMGIETEAVYKIVRTMVIFSIFWLFYDSVLVFDKAIYNFAKKFGRDLYREIGSFFVKTIKIFIVAVGLVAILQEWNINVSAFIASLGLGGLAFALAAKDTAANLFGGLTILADKSLKIDDWIKVGDVEGTVEDIGLRTTKVRTFEKSLVTVPNQIIANNPIENFSRRNIRRIKMRIGLTYDTSEKTMQNILKDIRNMLKSHPGIDKNATMLINFDRFEDSSLSIFIYTFTNTAVWAEYMNIREDVNLKIMKIVEDNGAEFAFPSQSIYVEKLPEEK